MGSGVKAESDKVTFVVKQTSKNIEEPLIFTVTEVIKEEKPLEEE